MQAEIAARKPDETATGTGMTDAGALVGAALAGDRDAFARLIDRHYQMIYRTAYKWSGNAADAEDIAQDVCIKLARNLSGWDRRAAFTSWVYRITLNTVHDLHRSRARTAKRNDSLKTLQPEEAPPAQHTDLEADDIWRAVRQLPEKQRDAVLLTYAEEKSHAEVAEIMGVREGTVSWYIAEAKKQLRGML